MKQAQNLSDRVLGEIKPITNREFSMLQELIHGTSGINLTPSKKSLLVSRLSIRLRELGIHSFAAYYQLLLEDDSGEEQIKLIDRITTNETSFFREPRQFEYLEKTLIPRWQKEAIDGERSKRIQIWSAGCSTGEEPYSIAMLLLKHFPPGGSWRVEIFATDISEKILERAEEGLWAVDKSSEIPEDLAKRFMLKGRGAQEGKMKAGSEIKSVIRFRKLNLNDRNYPVKGPFDLIFCRNVLIYFDQKSSLRVVHSLLDHLAPSGHLLLGHAESLLGRTNRVRSTIPTVYTLVDSYTDTEDDV
jgi:chemotaxis protein methyltransferase CheR